MWHKDKASGLPLTSPFVLSAWLTDSLPEYLQPRRHVRRGGCDHPIRSRIKEGPKPGHPGSPVDQLLIKSLRFFWWNAILQESLQKPKHRGQRNLQEGFKKFKQGWSIVSIMILHGFVNFCICYSSFSHLLLPEVIPIVSATTPATSPLSKVWTDFRKQLHRFQSMPTSSFSC